jgi:hypothetical protein
MAWNNYTGAYLSTHSTVGTRTQEIGYKGNRVHTRKGFLMVRKRGSIMKQVIDLIDKFVSKQKCKLCGSTLRFITGKTTFNGRWSITMECPKCFYKCWKFPKTLRFDNPLNIDKDKVRGSE